MAHPDKSWRVGAIYRCCVRYGKDQDGALHRMWEVFTSSSNVHNTVSIWFRNMDRRREEYRHEQS